MTAPTGDLIVPPGPGIPRGLVVAAGELHEQFSRSSGPGGQGVNTADSRVELRFAPDDSSSLTDAQRARVLAVLAERLVDGRLVVTASEHRSQLRNRSAARDRLAAMLREALAPDPPTRRPTKRTRGSQQRRLDAKKRRSALKARRGRPSAD